MPRTKGALGKTLKVRKPLSKNFKRIVRPPGVWIGHRGKSKLRGAESRTAMIQQAAVELDARGYTQREIAAELTRRFKMPKPYHSLQVCMVLGKARKLLFDDIKETQKELRLDAFRELEALRYKYHDIALAACVCIKKTKIKDGEQIDYIDEDSFDKQIDALNGYLKIMAQQAALMGLNIREPEIGEGSGMTPDGLRIWIQNNIAVLSDAHNEARKKGTPIIPMIDLEGGPSDQLDRRD